ncbi:proline dehydrogenase family protein [Planctomycetota bacterium]|nr:proline dehydrogenase family protein [Planctomycetota bacterium]
MVDHPSSQQKHKNMNRIPDVSVYDEQRIMQIGCELLAAMHEHEAKQAFSATEKLMDWAMKDHGFKVQLFRFVDTLPTLHTSSQVYGYLADFLLQPEVHLPLGMATALKAGKIFRPAVAMTTRKQIEHMAKRFIAGMTANEILPVLEKQWEKQTAFSIDLLGEECLSEEETDAYRVRYLELVQQLSTATKSWKAQLILEEGMLANVPRTNLSLKISSLVTKADPMDFEGTLAKLDQAIKPILLQAVQCGALINFDMENYALKDLTIEFFKQCCEKYNFVAGIALQAYLRSAEDDAHNLIEFTKRTGRQITVRLVKGAYWDFEVINAQQMGWKIPVWMHKHETDACYERVADLLLTATPRDLSQGGIHLALGSHNVRSIASVLSTLESQGLPKNAIEMQMLYGMADSIKVAIIERGYRLREYVPVGEFLPGMAYLVRRLLENTSNESWLRAGDHERLPDNVLLESPHEILDLEHKRAKQ